jgi:serine/threonine-protein kinase
MLYEMLTGVRPFRGDSMATLMFQIANEPHPDIREHRPTLPDSVAELIDKMLTKDPATRIANGNQVVRSIIGCLKDINNKGGNA